MKKGWEMKKLREVCTIRPPKKLAKEQLDDDQEVTFLPMEDLGIFCKSLIPTKTRPLSEVYSGYTYFADDDVLLAKITPCFENGKLGIARNLKNGIGFGSSEYLVFRVNDNLQEDFLYYYLMNDAFREEGRRSMSGAVGHKRVAKEFIENHEIPIPPLPEQQRIVAILDEAFAGIAQAKANAAQNLQNAKELFESYLQSVFEQKGEGWEEKTLDQISENLDRLRVPITKRDRVPGKVPYYGASGIVDYVEGFIFDEDLLCISEDGANLLARTYPIAFSITGKTWVNNHAHILRFSTLTTQAFVEKYLNSIKLDDFVSGMAQPKLNQKMLNKIPIPFPDIITQKSIVQKLDALSAETHRLEAIYQQKLEDLEELKKTILQKAFSGELNTEKIKS